MFEYITPEDLAILDIVSDLHIQENDPVYTLMKYADAQRAALIAGAGLSLAGGGGLLYDLIRKRLIQKKLQQLGGTPIASLPATTGGLRISDLLGRRSSNLLSILKRKKHLWPVFALTLGGGLLTYGLLD